MGCGGMADQSLSVVRDMTEQWIVGYKLIILKVGNVSSSRICTEPYTILIGGLCECTSRHLTSSHLYTLPCRSINDSTMGSPGGSWHCCAGFIDCSDMWRSRERCWESSESHSCRANVTGLTDTYSPRRKRNHAFSCIQPPCLCKSMQYVLGRLAVPSCKQLSGKCNLLHWECIGSCHTCSLPPITSCQVKEKQGLLLMIYIYIYIYICHWACLHAHS